MSRFKEVKARNRRLDNKEREEMRRRQVSLQWIWLAVSHPFHTFWSMILQARTEHSRCTTRPDTLHVMYRNASEVSCRPREMSIGPCRRQFRVRHDRFNHSLYGKVGDLGWSLIFAPVA